MGYIEQQDSRLRKSCRESENARFMRYAQAAPTQITIKSFPLLNKERDAR